jgi:hypothetical protein
VVEDADGGHPRAVVVAGETKALARSQGAGEHAHVGELLTGRATVDLEHRARDGSVDVALRRRQQLADAGREVIDAGAGDGRAEVHGMDPRLLGLAGERAAQIRVGDVGLVVEAGGEQRLVVVGEHLGEPRGEAVVGARVRCEASAARPDAVDRTHRDDGRRQLLGDGAQGALDVRAGAIDLVDEQQGGKAKALQRAHEHAGLRLHALHGRDDQHGPVEHGQSPLHLGDEVRVAGRVDQVDRDVVDRERDDGGPDRDAALALER